MEEVLNAWYSKFEYANEKKLTHFIFNVNGYFYLSSWENAKWSTPVLIEHI